MIDIVTGFLLVFLFYSSKVDLKKFIDNECMIEKALFVCL